MDSTRKVGEKMKKKKKKKKKGKEIDWKRKEGGYTKNLVIGREGSREETGPIGHFEI